MCSAVFQYRKKIKKIFDDVVAPFVGVFARSVEACGNPGVAAALHVGRQTVSDHESTFAAAFSDLRENLVVKILLGLFGAELLGDENVIKILRHAGTFNPPLLRVGIAVCDNDDEVFPVQRLQ